MLLIAVKPDLQGKSGKDGCPNFAGELADGEKSGFDNPCIFTKAGIFEPGNKLGQQCAQVIHAALFPLRPNQLSSISVAIFQSKASSSSSMNFLCSAG